MKRYVLMGCQPLEFPDLRVEPNLEGGTVFEYDLEPAREALLIKSGAIVVAPESAFPKPEKGRR